MKCLKCLLFAKKGFEFARKRIAVIDKCLILIMFILFLQLTYNLFQHEIVNEEIASIDIIVRSTIASIFGYFISANFIKHEQRHSSVVKAATFSGMTNTRVLNQGEYDQLADDVNMKYGFQDDSDSEDDPVSHLQIVIVTTIAITALLIMLMARNFTVLTPESSATISLLRDLVCSAVGFLLGYPTQPKKDS